MKYSTGQKKKLRLQGHRRRRRTISISKPEATRPPVSWSEYKTIRQYQSLGDILDEFRTYGFQGGMEHILEKNVVFDRDNGHYWLTSDQDG